jgi:hypothetical protein
MLSWNIRIVVAEEKLTSWEDMTLASRDEKYKRPVDVLAVPGPPTIRTSRHCFVIVSTMYNERVVSMVGTRRLLKSKC